MIRGDGEKAMLFSYDGFRIYDSDGTPDGGRKLPRGGKDLPTSSLESGRRKVLAGCDLVRWDSPGV
ncbi:MAG: hypothetical protein ACLUAR_14985 [Pilosibacter sp.]